MCASEALIQARMGIVTDANGKPIIYDHLKGSFTIKEGIICAKNTKVFKLCENRIQSALGKDIPAIHREVLADSERRKAMRSTNKVHKIIQVNPEVFMGSDPIAQRNKEILEEHRIEEAAEKQALESESKI